MSRPVGLQLRTCVSTSAASRRSLAGSALDRTRYAWSPTVSAIGADGMDARSLTLWVNDGNGVFGRWMAGSALHRAWGVLWRRLGCCARFWGEFDRYLGVAGFVRVGFREGRWGGLRLRRGGFGCLRWVKGVGRWGCECFRAD